MRERAAQITLADGVTIPLLHPLDVLESCLRNMDALPSKQNETGAAQTHASTSSSGRDSGRDFNARKIEFAALQERRRKLCGALRKKAGFAQEK